MDKDTENPKSGKRGRPKGTGSALVYAELKKKILRMDIPPGTDIDELGLAKEFSVSRTPIREALIRLATDGLITILPNRGARVSPLDFNEIPELLEGLEVCLRLTARWAAIRRTDNDITEMREYASNWKAAMEAGDVEATTEANNGIHLTIAIAAHNKHLLAMYQSVLPGFLRLTHSFIDATPMNKESVAAYIKRINNEHFGMIEAIERQDPEAADKISLEHANLIRSRVSQYLDRGISISHDGILPSKTQQL